MIQFDERAYFFNWVGFGLKNHQLGKIIPTHANDEDQNDEAQARAALNGPHMPEDIKYNYTVMRKILKYA